jgi:hypothetical protein
VEAGARFLPIAALLESFLFDFYLSRRSHKGAGHFKSIFLQIVLQVTSKNRY